MMVRRRSKTLRVTPSQSAEDKPDAETLNKDIIVTAPVGSIHDFSESDVTSMREKLLQWYDLNKRDLPWRKNNDPDINERAYAVWVSEIMLQQTQVATVINYYNKWMKKWPTLRSLAASNVEEVNEAWSGLGYYSRGRRLLEGAQKVTTELKGQMPRTARDLEKELPGVGRYTAAAIASIAFGEVTGLVDGNVVRVLSRLRAIGACSSQTEVMEKFWQLAHQVADPHRPGDLNQSLMELGATVCTPKLPQCDKCPVRSLCKAYSMAEADKVAKTSKICSKIVKKEEDVIDIECLVPDCKLCLPSDSPWDSELGVLNFPRKTKKASVKQEELNVVVLQASDEKHPSEVKFLICQRPKKGLLAGLWEFPMCPQQTSKAGVSSVISKLCGLEDGSVQGLVESGEVNHQFSHIHHQYKVYTTSLSPSLVGQVTEVEGRPVRWVTEKELAEAAVSTGMRKVFREYKKSTTDTCKTNKKRRSQPDVSITDPKRKQSSIVDFFKR